MFSKFSQFPFLAVALAMLSACQHTRDVTEWQAIRDSAVKAHVIKTKGNRIVIRAYAPQDHTGSLYKRRTYEMQTCDLTEPDFRKISDLPKTD